MASPIYTERFFVSSGSILPPSWTCPDDGYTRVLRDVWWSCPAIDVSSQTLILSIAGANVWGANNPGEGPGYNFWWWQGRQVVLPGESVSLSEFGGITTLIDWIGTGYRLTP